MNGERETRTKNFTSNSIYVWKRFLDGVKVRYPFLYNTMLVSFSFFLLFFFFQ